MECASSLRSETRTPLRISFADNFFLLKGIPAWMQFSACNPPYMKGAESNTRFTRYFRNRFTNTIPDNPLKSFSGQTGAKPYVRRIAHRTYSSAGIGQFGRVACPDDKPTSTRLDCNLLDGGLSGICMRKKPHTAFGSNNRMRGPARMNAWSTAA